MTTLTRTTLRLLVPTILAVGCASDEPRISDPDAGTGDDAPRAPDAAVSFTVQVDNDVKYSALHDYRLNIAYPDAGGPYPAVIFIHGGGWAPTGRAKYDPEIRDYAARGYVALTIDYPGRAVGWREIVKQGPKTAVKWLRANAATYHVDPDRIGVTGGSAGSHLGAMLATTADDPALRPNEFAGYSDRVQAACLFAGSYDLTYNWTYTGDPGYVRPILEMVFGGGAGRTPAVAPDEYAQGSPINHVSADDAAFCMCHGTADTTSPYQQVELMATALTAARVHVETLILEGAPHNWEGTEFYAPGRAQMDRFFDTFLAAP